MFDIIIDKATMDALLCDSFENFAETMIECQRVIKTGGYYVAISFAHPDDREFHFKRDHLKFDIKTLTSDLNGVRYYIYICQKMPGADEAAKMNWLKVREQVKAEDVENKKKALKKSDEAQNFNGSDRQEILLKGEDDKVVGSLNWETAGQVEK